ncbi:MAG: hypothetical protein Q8N98_00665 [bacterium]|nr:hypothetical protein [bacterium]
MNIKKVIAQLKRRYPSKNIVITDPKDPTEIICEIEPTEFHPTRSTAVAVVDKIRPHYHLKLTEVYEVIRGTLTIHLGGKMYIVHKNEKIEIKPNTIHWAEGDETCFFAHSRPGWIPEDHILVFAKREISRKAYDSPGNQNEIVRGTSNVPSKK